MSTRSIAARCWGCSSPSLSFLGEAGQSLSPSSAEVIMLSWCRPRSSPGMWRDTVLEHPMLLVLRTRAMATNVQKILCRVKFKFRWLCAHPRTFLPPTLKDRPEIDNVPEVSASGLSWEQPDPKSVDQTEICDSERRDIARQTVRIPQAPRFFSKQWSQVGSLL